MQRRSDSSSSFVLALTVGDGSPCRSRGGTVKADLVGGDRTDLLELLVLVGRRQAHLPATGSRDHAVLAEVAAGSSNSGGAHSCCDDG